MNVKKTEAKKKPTPAMKTISGRTYDVYYEDDRTSVTLSSATVLEVCERVAPMPGGNAVMGLFSECDRLGEACFVNPVGHINVILWRAD
jgi:hypothetical protein